MTYRGAMSLHAEPTALPPELLATPLRGRHLAGATLGAALAGAPTLLIFLRHLG